MSRFVRNLLLAQCAIFLGTQYASAFRGLPLWSWLGVFPSVHRWAFAWQWATHPLIEQPGDLSLIGFGLAIFVAYSTYPQVESAHGRRTFVTVLAASTALGGALALGTAWLRPPAFPASGAFGPILGLLGFELWNRRHGQLFVKLLPTSETVHPIGAREAAAILLGFVAIQSWAIGSLTTLALDLGSILGGVLVGTSRERGSRQSAPRRSLRVIKGGRDDPRTLN